MKRLHVLQCVLGGSESDVMRSNSRSSRSGEFPFSVSVSALPSGESLAHTAHAESNGCSSRSTFARTDSLVQAAAKLETASSFGMAAKTRKCFRMRQRCWLFVIILLSAISGDTEMSGSIWQPCLATIATFPAVLMYARIANIEFGSSGLTQPQLKWEALVSMIYLLVLLPWGCYHLVFQPSLELEISTYGLGAITYHLFNRAMTARTLAFVRAAVCLFKGLTVLWSDSLTIYMDHKPWICFSQAGIVLIMSFARYRKDQLNLDPLVTLVMVSSYAGHQLLTQPYWFLVTLHEVLFVLYIIQLWTRRHRQLPPGLRGCRFITLSYMRRLVASGTGIRRCQDLPDDAFGDPSKAAFLIAVSHRWLDRLRCDIRTHERPEGYRLGTMVEQLDAHFSEENFLRGWRQGGVCEVLRRTGMSLTGGEDVVLFFDFMSLPQEGQGVDGRIACRNSQEERRFRRCLRHMGVLYSMLPVLVCEEVVEGAHGYDASGWCFAEASTAWLGNQLSIFSSKTSIIAWFEKWQCDISDSDALMNQLDRELESKHFHDDSDRRTARSILRGFVVKRDLVQAICARSPEKLKEVLAEISHRWTVLLDQPVDAKLNTPLHLAVAYNFSEGVLLLLEQGADPTLRNLQGDTPVQLLAFPRLSTAAWTCRRTKPTERPEENFCEEGIRFSVSRGPSGSNSKVKTQASGDSTVRFEDGAVTVSFDEPEEWPSHGFSPAASMKEAADALESPPLASDDESVQVGDPCLEFSEEEGEDEDADQDQDEDQDQDQEDEGDDEDEFEENARKSSASTSSSDEEGAPTVRI